MEREKLTVDCRDVGASVAGRSSILAAAYRCSETPTSCTVNALESEFKAVKAVVKDKAKNCGARRDKTKKYPWRWPNGSRMRVVVGHHG